MRIACAHGACDCPGYPGQSAHSEGHVGGQHVSEKALLRLEKMCRKIYCAIVSSEFIPFYLWICITFSKHSSNNSIKNKNKIVQYRFYNCLYF